MFVVLVCVLGAAAFIERRPIAAFVVQAYLLKYGIHSSFTFDELTRGRFVAHVRAGWEMPEFSADSVDVSLTYSGLFSYPQVSTVRVVRPVLRASFDGQRFSFGSLQPLIDEILAQPPTGPGPNVSVEGATVYMTTPAGLLQIAIDATADKGELSRLTASLTPSSLRNQNWRADIREARVAATARDGKLNGSATVRVAAYGSSIWRIDARDIEASVKIDGAEWHKTDAVLDFTAANASLLLKAASLQTPDGAIDQPDVVLTLAVPAGHLRDGAIALSAARANADLRGGQAGSSAFSATSPEGHFLLEAMQSEWSGNRGNLAAAFANVILATEAVKAGQTSAAKTDARLDLRDLRTNFEAGTLSGTGRAEATLALRTVRSGGYAADALSVNAANTEANAQWSAQNWSLSGPVRTSFDGKMLRYPLRRDAITVASVHGTASGAPIITAAGLEGGIAGSLTANATLPQRLANDLAGDLPVLSADPKLARAVASALAGFNLQIPAFNIAQSSKGTVLRIAQPVVLSANSGARSQIAAQANRPLLSMTGNSIDGGFSADIHGGGLPDVTLDVPVYRMAGTGRAMTFDATAALQAKGDYGTLTGVRLTANTAVTRRNGVLSAALQRCADIAFASYGAKDVRQISDVQGQVCPDAATALLRVTDSGWGLRAVWSGARATLDQAQATFAQADGRIVLTGDGAGPKDGRLDIAHATIADTQAAVRYRPISATGALVLAKSEWAGTLNVAARDRKLAAVQVRYDMQKGAGSAAINAADIAFDPMFQPTDISPLLAPVGTRVRGHASFAGIAAWNADGIQSSGTAHVLDIDTQTQLGMARGVRGDVSLTSLVPIAFAPNQTINVRRIDWPVPVEQVSARYTLTPAGIQLEESSGNVAGGRASLDPLTYSFMPGATTRGTIRLEHIDMTPLVTAAGLTGKVAVTARVGGALPFTFGPEGLRFANGHIAAESDGRLAIQRSALTGGVETGAGGKAQPNAVQDFAYQALENLSFTELNGDVNSRPMGRLGVLLHVKGQHDPAQTVETRVGVVELLQGRAFDKPLPLPKGTPIDLTLDTSLNLDELLESYFGRQPPMNAAAK